MAAEQLTLDFEALCLGRIHVHSDGTFTGRFVKPVKRPDMLFTRDVMKRTGLKKSQAVAVMHQLGAEQRHKGCLLRVSAAALEAHLKGGDGNTVSVSAA